MRSLLFISVLLLTYINSFAQPQIFFPETIRHYGDIEANSDGGRHFVFTNTGDEPLQILGCKTSCGCLVAAWPKEPIQPGEWAEIRLLFHTGGGRVGRFVKSITVKSNDTLQPIKILRIDGHILEEKYVMNRELKAKSRLMMPDRMMPIDSLSFSLDYGIDTSTQDTQFVFMINTHFPVDVFSTNHLIHDTYLQGDTLVFDIEHLACGASDPGNMKQMHYENFQMPPMRGRKLIIKVKNNRSAVLMEYGHPLKMISP
jgi:hypothetical protein